MKLGMLGRDPAVMQRALALAARLGHDAKGTLQLDEAMGWLQDGSIEGLVIGGGIADEPRAALLARCQQRGVRSIEVFGPANLEPMLAELS